MLSSPKKLLNLIDEKFRRSRPGSVLIIVIVLLLLLAILGAAYLSTTRSDRVASAQNVLNANVDTMLNGIAKVCEGTLVDDLNNPFGDLHGNTAYASNTNVNRSVYQGQAGAAPPVTPNVPVATGYQPGDIVNDAANPSIFYSVPLGNSAVLTPGTAVAPSAGWQLMNGNLSVTALGSNPWLADRIPTLSAANSPSWQNITQLIQVAGVALQPVSILGTQFEDPTYTSPGPGFTPARNPTATTGTVITSKLNTPLVGGNKAALTPLIPTYIILPNGNSVPALTYDTGTPTAPNTFAAADADGDGIADSLFFRVPGMSTDGLTWFAGVRIIDNNSAINANTAWSRDTESYYPPNAAANSTNTWALFQTSVGLLELINGSDNINTFNQYRFYDTGPTAGQDPYDESPIGYNATTAANTTKVNNPPQAFGRGNANASDTIDYNFISQSEAFYQQFICRMSNPGYNTYTYPVGSNPPTGNRYQALPLSDEAALAYHFGLVNPETTLSQTPSSILENLLPFSTTYYTAAAGTTPPKYYRSIPYGGIPLTDVNTWFNDNFNYDAASPTYGGAQPIRPLFVTHNPVSNYIPQIYDNSNPLALSKTATSDPILPNDMLPYSGSTNQHYKGVWNAATTTTYNQNDIVVWPGAIAGYYGPSYTFISVVPTNSGHMPASVSAGTPANSYNSLNSVTTAFWQLQPWSVNPVKANVNTATFRELFRAFWCVMAGNPSNVTPFGITPAAIGPNGIYDDSALTGNPQRMFRSPLRDPTASLPTTATQLDIPPGNAGGIAATYQNTMLLRAAIAAVNTLGLRDNSQNIVSHTFVLNNAWVAGGAAGSGGAANAAAGKAAVEVRVYSNAPQPFISEVYVNTYAGASANGVNPSGYVAIELYNPYPVPISMINWKLAFINRPPAAAIAPNLPYPQLQVQQIATLGSPGNPTHVPPIPPAPIIIPPFSYMLLENCNYAGAIPPSSSQVDPNAATYRPVDSAILPTSGAAWTGPATPPPPPAPSYLDQYIPFLENVIAGTIMPPVGSPSPTSPGGELVLLRPRRSDGVLTTYVDPTGNIAPGNESFDETNNLWDYVPVDSYDFTNLTQQAATDTTYAAWSYIRGKGAGNLFKTTYPGTYVGTVNVPGSPRETGTASQAAVPNATAPTWTSLLGGGPAPYSQPVFGLPSAATYPDDFAPVQIYNVGDVNTSGTPIDNLDSMHFPNSLSTPIFNVATNPAIPATPSVTTATGVTTKFPPYLHPHGGFARNGDMLDIPFIGAYRIRVVNNTTAPNTLTYPVQNFLELNSVTMDCSFAAVNDGNTVSPLAEAQNVGRFVPMAAHVAGYTGPDYYAWTRNLFNYLTVQSSTDTYTPNFDPNLSSTNYTSANPIADFAYPPQISTAIPPTPVLTASASASDQTNQDSVGVEGLININTASWKVLSMLPMVQNSPAKNEILAKAIVTYRTINGPFTSIFDLNQVPGFISAEGTTSPTGPTSAAGLLSPADSAFGTASALSTTPPLGNENDYQGDCLTLTRISNLITTRSDTFTVYIVVQGWQNAGSTDPTKPPQPMITRRYSFIADRSAINADPSTRFLKTLTVPND